MLLRVTIIISLHDLLEAAQVKRHEREITADGG